MIIILILILVVTYFVLLQILNKPKFNFTEPKLNYVFAPPGAGKTTTVVYLTRLVDQLRKKNPNLNIYCTEELKGVSYYHINKDDVGKYEMSKGILLIDEASILFNNRKFMPQNQIEFFKKHRHRKLEIWIFSQDNNDVEITLRRLCTNFYYLKKSILYPINKTIVMKKIKKGLEIDKNTRQVIDGYDFVKFSTFRIWARPNWKYFDSFEYELLPDLPKERRIDK